MKPCTNCHTSRPTLCNCCSEIAARDFCDLLEEAIDSGASLKEVLAIVKRRHARAVTEIERVELRLILGGKS